YGSVGGVAGCGCVRAERSGDVGNRRATEDAGRKDDYSGAVLRSEDDFDGAAEPGGQAAGVARADVAQRDAAIFTQCALGAARLPDRGFAAGNRGRAVEPDSDGGGERGGGGDDAVGGGAGGRAQGDRNVPAGACGYFGCC